MTIRSTLCTLAAVAATTLVGCSGSSNEFGMHRGGTAPTDELTASFARSGETIYYVPEASLDASDVETYEIARSGTGVPAVKLTLTEEAGSKVRQWSSQHIGDYVVFTVNGEVIAAPKLMATLDRHIVVSDSGDAAEWFSPLEAALESAGAKQK